MDNSDIKEGLESYYNKRDNLDPSKDKNIRDRIKVLEEEMQSLKASI